MPLRRCAAASPAPVGVLGFREPSAVFLFGRGSVTDAETIAGLDGRRARRPSPSSRTAFGPTWQGSWHCAAPSRRRAPAASTAFNIMRGCTLDFSIYVTGADALDDGCHVAERFRCPARRPRLPEAPDHASRCR